jgi:STE24 endopeptidase
MFALSLPALRCWAGCPAGWFYTGLGVQPLSCRAGSAPNDALALLLFMLAVPVFTSSSRR